MKPGFYNMDCMEALKIFPDNFFDLAIVDPPYGGGYAPENKDAISGLRGGGHRLAAQKARPLRRRV